MQNGAKLVQIGAMGSKWCQPARAFLSPAPQAPTRVLATGRSRLLLNSLNMGGEFLFKIIIKSFECWEASSCGTTCLIISLLCCRVPASHSWTKKKRAAQQNESRTTKWCKTSNLNRLYLGAPFMETLEPDL